MTPTKQLLIAILLVMLHNTPCLLQRRPSCSSGNIACFKGEKCVQLGYICDGDNDCGDMSDEGFCTEWRATGCSDRGKALCRRHGSTSCISMVSYCTATNPPCAGTVDPRICQMLEDGYLQRLSDMTTPTVYLSEEPTTEPSAPTLPKGYNLVQSEIQGQLLSDTWDETLKHPDCPMLYTRVGQQCVSLFFFLKLGWGDANEFCKLIGGELVSYHGDDEGLILLMRHMRNFDLTADFWIGGRYVNDTEEWSWVTGEAMDLGSPFWAIRYNHICLPRKEETGTFATAYWTNKTSCYYYQQSPTPNGTELCAAITFRHYYHISDEDCLRPRSPLCLANSNTTSIKL